MLQILLLLSLEKVSPSFLAHSSLHRSPSLLYAPFCPISSSGSSKCCFFSRNRNPIRSCSSLSLTQVLQDPAEGRSMDDMTGLPQTCPGSSSRCLCVHTQLGICSHINVSHLALPCVHQCLESSSIIVLAKG